MAKRLGRVTDRQREIILDYMESNEGLVTSRFSAQFTKKTLDTLWDNLTLRLNSEGNGAVKDVKKWKKCWQSWKSDTKSKAATGKKQKHITGGGDRPDDIELTPLEKRLLSIIGVTAVEGNADLNEVFFTMPDNDVEAQFRTENQRGQGKQMPVREENIHSREVITPVITSSQCHKDVFPQSQPGCSKNYQPNINITREISVSQFELEDLGANPSFVSNGQEYSIITEVNDLKDTEGSPKNKQGTTTSDGNIPSNNSTSLPSASTPSTTKPRGKNLKRKQEFHYERATAALKLMEDDKTIVLREISESFSRIASAEESKALAQNRIAVAVEEKALAVKSIAASASAIVQTVANLIQIIDKKQCNST